MDQQTPPENPLLKETTKALIGKFIELRNYMDGEQLRLSEFLRPYQEQKEAIQNEVQRRLLAEAETGASYSFKGIGTAYLEHRNNFSSSDKIALLDFCLENWDQRGAIIQIGAPKVEAVKSYMDDNNGELPPTVTNSPEIKCIIRKSK